MTFSTRLLLALGLCGTFAGIVAYLSANNTAHGKGGAGTGVQGVRWESASQCKACHADVYAEWLGSHHQISFTNPEVRALSDDFRKEECMDCHLPRPLAITGFGKRTLPRRTHFDEGVSCISCHLAEDGGLLARNDRPEVPCKPRRREEFFAVSGCESCHNQHGTTDQWRASPFARQNIDCASCHMPEVARVRKDGSQRMGRGHGFPGAHDPALLKKAGQFVVIRDGDQIVFTLTNTGAGHNFPTEERHRAVDIVYRFVTKASAEEGANPAAWTLAWRARQPYRDESTPVGPGAASTENTQLPAGHNKQVRVEVPAGAIAVEARLWYRLTPFCGDDSPLSTLLEERRLEL